MLPASGEISIGSIYNELTGAYPEAYSDRSINQCETGTYGAINQNSAAKPDGATPNSFAEWYSYNHSAGGGKTTEILNLISDGTSVSASLSTTETAGIVVYGGYYNQYGYNEPFSIVISAGNIYSNVYYDPDGVVLTPDIYHIEIGGVAFYSSPSEGPTHFWEWVW